jgi:hypothetical protein
MNIPANIRKAITERAKGLSQFDEEEKLLLAVMRAPVEDVTEQHYNAAFECLDIIRQERAKFIKDFAWTWLTKKGRG